MKKRWYYGFLGIAVLATVLRAHIQVLLSHGEGPTRTTPKGYSILAWASYRVVYIYPVIDVICLLAFAYFAFRGRKPSLSK
jgi:ABC-type phosphate transport system permease subunit